MGGFTAKCIGLHELDEKLTALGTKAAQKVIREGLEAGGEVFRAAIIERAPERVKITGSKTALRPGLLKMDIGMKFGQDSAGLPAAIVAPGKYTAHVARWVEYGHRQIRKGWSRIIKTGRNAGKHRGPGREIGDVPAHPFIRPAYEATRETAAAKAIKTIAAGIEREAKRQKPGS